MAEQDRDDGPNLELPSFGLRRRRKKDRAAASGSEEPAAGDTSGDTAASPGTTTTDTAASPGAAADEAPTHRKPRKKVGTAPAESGAAPAESDAARDESGAAPAESDAAREPLVTDEGATAASTGPHAAARHPEPATSDEAPTAPADEADEGEAEGEGPVQHTPLVTLPPVNGWVAAVITGLVVGVTLVLLTYASLRFCEVVKGTSSCGGPGLLLLGAILVALIFLGRALLGAWHVPDPLSTSFLAVGLLAVIVLLVLVDVVFSPMMALVIPLVSVATFALSHWVTTSVVEPGE